MPQPIPALRALGLCAALVTAALPAQAAQANFDFTVSGIRVGALNLASEVKAGGYTATARMETAGVVGIFADFFYDGQASGTITGDGTVVPGHYASTTRSPTLRHSRIEWKGGVPVEVSVEPPHSHPPDPARQGGTLDPVSASVRLFRDAPPDAICNTTVTIFDGSRLSRLRLSAPVANKEGLSCAGTYARLEGEAMSSADLREFPFTLTFSRSPSGLAQFQRIEAPTSFGPAVIARRP